MQQQRTYLTTMVDDRDDDAKLREIKVDNEMNKLDIKIKMLKQAAAEDLRRTREGQYSRHLNQLIQMEVLLRLIRRVPTVGMN